MSFAHIIHHTLRISKPDKSLDFYQNKLGMTLINQQELTVDGKAQHHYDLGFPTSKSLYTSLKLVYQDSVPAKVTSDDPNIKDGYWKIGITLEDVDLGRNSLLAAGVEVSEPKQFRDIGYLCHLQDPDGHSIELLQHHFAQNHRPIAPRLEYKLQSKPTVGQITLRVKDAEKSLHFYQNGLGMRLLSRQIVEPYRFTLYFLAYTDDALPYDDIDHVGNREWLWQRPYTTLELQHNWGTESVAFEYRTGLETGFLEMGFALPNIAQTIDNCEAVGAKILDDVVLDPDGYQVRLVPLDNKEG